jgi:uncharacterized protein
MPRPRKCRYIETSLPGQCFKPCRGAGSPKNATTIFLDELEAVRLGDIESLSQEDAALKMGISRSTFARIINEAHRKIADAIIFSKPIVTEGEEQFANKRNFKCDGCGHEWRMKCGTGCPKKCPECGELKLHKTNCGRQYQRQSARGAGAKLQNTRVKGRCCDTGQD